MPLGPPLRSSVPASPANSHIVPIGDRCGEAEHLGEAVAREIRVFPYDVLVRHAFGQARQDERRREVCSPDRGFPAQAFGIRHEVSEPWNRCVVHVFPLGRPSFPLRSPIQTEVYVPRGPGPDVLRFPEHALHDRPLPLHSLDCGTTLLTTSSRSPSTGTPSTSWASRTLATSTPSRRSVFPLVRRSEERRVGKECRSRRSPSH